MYKKGQKGKKEVSEQKRKDKEKKLDAENDKSRDEEEEEEERMEEEPDAENEAEEEEVENWEVAGGASNAGYKSSDTVKDEMHSSPLRLSPIEHNLFKLTPLCHRATMDQCIRCTVYPSGWE